MEYMIELDDARQLTLPEPLVADLQLGPGAHFSARVDAGRLIIESVPFSRLEQAKSLERTIDDLTK